jgi:hypothetical protein
MRALRFGLAAVIVAALPIGAAALAIALISTSEPVRRSVRQRVYRRKYGRGW